jgi:hypothetical protein
MHSYARLSTQFFLKTTHSSETKFIKAVKKSHWKILNFDCFKFRTLGLVFNFFEAEFSFFVLLSISPSGLFHLQLNSFFCLVLFLPVALYRSDL